MGSGRWPSFIDRFWSHVDKAGDCWLWTGEKSTNGYGRVGLRSRYRKSVQRIHAHRIAYMLFHGDPGDSLICHRCDVRLCVNPAHLFAGTHTDNTHDMIQKGRAVYVRGERCWASKLNAAQVIEMRAAHASGERSAALALRYGVRRWHVNAIVRRSAWKHV